MKTSGILLVLMIVFAFSPRTNSELGPAIPTSSNNVEPTTSVPRKKLVLLDYYFNNEWKKDAAGVNGRWHYTWEDKANSGFSMLGEIFRKNGFETASLTTHPTKKKLKNASIYIIVDPDTEKETERPNYITETDADIIEKWVKKGGVLILMGNDSVNSNLNSLNVLSTRFGIRFNQDMFNPVAGKLFEQGSVMVPSGHSVFPSPKKLYLKELSTLQVSGPATTILTKEGKNIMAVSRYGKGSVFALGDPWIYNEYIDNHILPADFENFKGAEDLVRWAISQSGK